MTLTTHAVIGAAITSVMPQHLVLGFSLALASHYLCDAIPHWDYSISDSSDKQNKKLNFMDLLKIGFDISLGILLALYFFTLSNSNLFWIPLIGVIGGTLPDALQFVYWKFSHQPITFFQNLHNFFHSKYDLNNKPLIGITIQTLIITIVIIIFKQF